MTPREAERAAIVAWLRKRGLSFRSAAERVARAGNQGDARTLNFQAFACEDAAELINYGDHATGAEKGRAE